MITPGENWVIVDNMEEVLRPATDKMGRAVTLEPQLATAQQRLALLRTVLGAVLQEASRRVFQPSPKASEFRGDAAHDFRRKQEKGLSHHGLSTCSTT